VPNEKKLVDIHASAVSSRKKSTWMLCLQSVVSVGSESLNMFPFKVQVVQELLPKDHVTLLVSIIVTGLWNM
jgi:hypothetical protein